MITKIDSKIKKGDCFRNRDGTEYLKVIELAIVCYQPYPLRHLSFELGRNRCQILKIKDEKLYTYDNYISYLHLEEIDIPITNYEYESIINRYQQNENFK